MEVSSCPSMLSAVVIKTLTKNHFGEEFISDFNLLSIIKGSQKLKRDFSLGWKLTSLLCWLESKLQESLVLELLVSMPSFNMKLGIWT